MLDQPKLTLDNLQTWSKDPDSLTSESGLELRVKAVHLPGTLGNVLFSSLACNLVKKPDHQSVYTGVLLLRRIACSLCRLSLVCCRVNWCGAQPLFLTQVSCMYPSGWKQMLPPREEEMGSPCNSRNLNFSQFSLGSSLNNCVLLLGINLNCEGVCPW